MDVAERGLIQNIGMACWFLAGAAWAVTLALPRTNLALAAAGVGSSLLLLVLLWRRRPDLLAPAGAGALGLAIDQLLKAVAVAQWAQEPGLTLLPGFFRLTHAENPGAILGLFPGHRSAFIVTGFATVLVIWLYYRMTGPDEGLVRFCLWLVLAGTLGNTLDRIFLGHVVDMFELSLAGQQLTVFNLADLLIDVSVVVIAVDVLRHGFGEGPRSGSQPDRTND